MKPLSKCPFMPKAINVICKAPSLLFPVLETVTTRGNYFPSLLGIIELRGVEIRIDIGWWDNCCGSQAHQGMKTDMSKMPCPIGCVNDAV